MKHCKIFIVEDDPTTAMVMKSHLKKDKSAEIEICMSAKELRENLHKSPDIITLDYNLPDANGEECLKSILQYNNKIPVVIVSGQNDISTAVKLVKAGAWDYIVKDKNLKENLLFIVSKIKERTKMQERISYLESEVEKKYKAQEIIKGNSPVMEKVFVLIEKAAKSNIAVSVTGKTGTGKELVAKSVHFSSARRKKPFVAINVAAIPNELIESELFGYEKGAFTGAHQRRIGKFEEANEGTLFLDEIGDMDLSMQAKLLRVLQENEFSRLGSNEKIKLNVRLIIATHKNLLDAVKDKTFREDLYFRLLGLPIPLPLLKDRGNDIGLLAKFFIDSFCDSNEMAKKSLSSASLNKLMAYNFPGNVRELKALMDLACVMANDDIIEPEDLTFLSHTNQMNIFAEEMSLHEYELRIVRHFMEKYKNVRTVADKLNIGKTTVYRIMKEVEDLRQNS